MVNSYARAYTEVLEIIKYLPKEEYYKIPKEKIEFYKANMDTTYEFSINPEIELSKQNISREANAVIINLFQDYFATEEQKNKIQNILRDNERKIEEEKRKKYNPDDLFKDKKRNIKAKEENHQFLNQFPNEQQNVSMIEYKDNFFVRFKKLFYKIFHFETK